MAKSEHPHDHFWFDLHKGNSINASDGSSYHIQHAVRNPTKFGFKDAAEMRQHSKHDIEDIESGYRDIDYDLEHHIMSKGFVRGYSGKPETGGYYGDRKGFFHVDAFSDDHAKQALKHFLPHIEDAEKTGSGYDIDLSIGHRGLGADYKGFGTAKEVREYIGTGALPVKAPPAEKPEGEKEPQRELPSSFGKQGTTQQVKTQKSYQAQGMPRWQAAAKAGFQEGYKSFKQCFSEALKKKMKNNW
jgi:hypothetical protein